MQKSASRGSFASKNVGYKLLAVRGGPLFFMLKTTLPILDGHGKIMQKRRGVPSFTSFNRDWTK